MRNLFLFSTTRSSYELDIFLTTMKPLQKVVTAQDIESSLYYVHVDGAEDEKLREILIREQDHRVSNGEVEGNTSHSVINGVLRKPLPASPELALGDRPAPPPKIYPYYQSPTSGAWGAAQYGRQTAGYSVTSTRANPELPPRHSTQNLLGPRPMHQRLRSADSAALEPVPERQNATLRRWPEQPTMTGPSLPPRLNVRRKEVPNNQSPMGFGETSPALPPRPNIDRKEFLQSQSSRYSGRSLELPEVVHSNGYRLDQESTSLTLIRRYNGLQWNVGKISSDLDSLSKDPFHTYGTQNDRNNGHLNGALSIEIPRPGYSKFVNPSLQSDQSNIMDSPRILSDHDTLGSEDGTGAQSVFRRQLQASRDETRPELKHASTSAISSRNERSPRPSFNFHRSSHQSENNIKSDHPASPASLHSKTPKTNHYTFRSPWNGICDFDVGVLGRSIKCKHTLGSRFIQVSELRFNLPSSRAFGPPPKTPSPNGTTTKEAKRSSFFSTTTQHQRQRSSIERYDSRSHDEVNSEEADERMDLSLGQELAGGGFAGKQAKLGKLIVEEEGLKMLDLVVAANMGIWWKVYGRVL